MEELSSVEKLLTQYYNELDPDKRAKRLVKLEASGYDPNCCAVIRQLYERRYKPLKHGTADNFVAAWMELGFVAENTSGNPKSKHNLKLVHKGLSALCLTDVGFPEDVLYEELKNLIRRCVNLALQKKHKIFGVGINPTPEAAEQSMQKSVLAITERLPVRFGLQSEFAPLTRAAAQVLSELMDKSDDEEEDI